MDLVIDACRVGARAGVVKNYTYAGEFCRPRYVHWSKFEMQNKPLFRWAGSKAKLLPRLKAFWSVDFVRYVEPFAGSASLFFRLAPQKAILSDINRELIHAYKAVRKKPVAVSDSL